MENVPKTDGYLKVEMFWCHSKDVEGFRSMTRVCETADVLETEFRVKDVHFVGDFWTNTVHDVDVCPV